MDMRVPTCWTLITNYFDNTKYEILRKLRYHLTIFVDTLPCSILDLLFQIVNNSNCLLNVFFFFFLVDLLPVCIFMLITFFNPHQNKSNDVFFYQFNSYGDLTIDIFFYFILVIFTCLWASINNQVICSFFLRRRFVFFFSSSY